jgi:hypothetical protein
MYWDEGSASHRAASRSLDTMSATLMREAIICDAFGSANEFNVAIKLYHSPFVTSQ